MYKMVYSLEKLQRHYDEFGPFIVELHVKTLNVEELNDAMEKRLHDDAMEKQLHDGAMEKRHTILMVLHGSQLLVLRS